LQWPEMTHSRGSRNHFIPANAMWSDLMSSSDRTRSADIVQVNGPRAKYLRTLKGWGQEELAGRSALRLRTIQRMEGSGRARLSTVQRLAEALDVRPDDLLVVGRSSEPFIPNVERIAVDQSYFAPLRTSDASSSSTQTKQLVAMISSTIRGLEEHRLRARDACHKLRVLALTMEHEPASTRDAIAESLRMVDEADLYIGIFAHWYGSVPDGADRSITEIEYARAVERRIPRLIFLMHEDHPVRAADVEKGTGAERLDRLKECMLKLEQPALRYFRSVSELESLVVQSLSLHILQRQATGKAGSRDLSRLSQFLSFFRTRLGSLYIRWDLSNAGVVWREGEGKLEEARLDEIYLPMRLAEGHDIREIDRGKPLLPEELLQRTDPLVVRGLPGSGKTTWMRWTFRRLLESGRALPIMVELRALARFWREARGSQRCLDAFLLDWLAQHALEANHAEFRQLLGNPPPGLRPVMLVDGWDELGDLGEELRHKLVGFMQEYRDVLVVVSSRPFGEGRPSHSEGFKQVLDIQPLNDIEVRQLARSFFGQCYGEDQPAVERAVGEFLNARNVSAEASDLSRTALFLTMMLLISRVRPLPDKRHQLYQSCIENLLTALPDRRAAEGARPLLHQYCPDNSDERMRLAAHLAFQMQEAGYRNRHRREVVLTWEEMELLLPVTWTQARRKGFLLWLACSAGLLIDRADGTLCFAHLSFQEYLTAWYLNATVEGDESRKRAFQEKVSDIDWWETLRLWAAIVEAVNPQRLEPVLRDLSDDRQGGLWLAGCMFADARGSRQTYRNWTGKVSAELLCGWETKADRCAQAWALSRQQERRDSLFLTLKKAAGRASWPAWLRCHEWARKAHFDAELTRPATDTNSCAILDVLLDGHIETRAQVAVGRVLKAAHPLWPLAPEYLLLLRLWPARRALAGTRLQMLASLSSERELLLELAREVLVPLKWDNAARRWLRSWSRYWGRDSAREWAFDLATYWASDSAREWASESVRDFTRDGFSYWIRTLVPDRARTWARDWAQAVARDRAREAARTWASRLGWKSGHLSLLEQYGILHLFSHGLMSSRTFLAQLHDESPTSVTRLFQAACRLALSPTSASREMDDALQQLPADTDLLWPALARHIARRATADDRALLEDLAQHPERRDPPLSWGLKYWVRGDVLLNDGVEVTLNELCDELGLPRLPSVEAMQDEPGVDSDEAEGEHR
jgi:transcriptional regulator with XRE-family HTH domain